jgi:hypothetical protein
MSDQPARPADAFALPVNQEFGTSGRQLENDNRMQKIPLERSGRRPRRHDWGLPGSSSSMPAATRSRLRQGHGSDGKQRVLGRFAAMFHNISYANPRFALAAPLIHLSCSQFWQRLGADVCPW